MPLITSYETYGTNDVVNQDAVNDSVLENKKNKLLERLAQKKAKLGMDSAADLQQGLSDVVDDAIWTRDDGSKYTIDYVPAKDKFGQDTVNPVEREWVEDPIQKKFGGPTTRNLYMDNTVDGAMKLGLARNDVNPNVISPYTGKPITPYEARYIDKTKASPYLGGGGQYDGTPGAKGVTVEDGSLLDIELPYDRATAFEYNVHNNKGQIENRAIGQGPVSREDIINYGAGKTEYMTDNAPLMNINFQQTEAPLAAGTPLPKDPYIHEDNIPEWQKKLREDDSATNDNGFFASLARGPKAALAGAATTGVGTADWMVEGAGDLLSKVGLNTDDWDIATEEEKSVIANKLVGYDDRYTKQTKEEISKNYDKITKNVELLEPSTWSHLLDEGKPELITESLKKAFSSPEQAFYSLGYMVPALIDPSKKTKIGAKITKNVAEGMTEFAATKAAKKGASKADMAAYLGAKATGTALLAADATNNQLDEYKDNNGNVDAGMMTIGRMFIINFGLYSLDVKITKDIIANPTPGKMAAILDKLPKNVVAQGLAKTAKVGAAMTAAGFKEMPQEFSQTLGEAFNKKYGSEEHKNESAVDVATSPDVLKESTVASVLGLAGGVHMSAGGSAVNSVLHGTDHATEAVKSKFKNKNELPEDDANGEMDGELLKSVKGKTFAEGKRIVDEFYANTPEPTEEQTKDIEASIKHVKKVKREESLMETKDDISTGTVSAKKRNKYYDEIDGMTKEQARLHIGLEAQKLGDMTDEQYAEISDIAIMISELKDGDVIDGKEAVRNASHERESEIMDAYLNHGDEAEAKAYRELMIAEHKDDTDGDIVAMFDKADELRKISDELDGTYKVREGVVSTGLTDKLKGFKTYFTNALKAESDAEFDANLGEIERFSNVQLEKSNKLKAGHENVMDKIDDQVKKVMDLTDASKSDVVLAMAARNALFRKGTASALKARQAQEKLLDLAKNLDNTLTKAEINNLLKVSGETTFKYASDNEMFKVANEKYANREAGNFIIRHEDVINTYVNDNGVDTSVDGYNNEDYALEIADRIDREIESMKKAYDILTKHNGKSEPLVGEDIDENIDEGDNKNSGSEVDNTPISEAIDGKDMVGLNGKVGPKDNVPTDSEVRPDGKVVGTNGKVIGTLEEQVKSSAPIVKPEPKKKTFIELFLEYDENDIKTEEDYLNLVKRSKQNISLYDSKRNPKFDKQTMEAIVEKQKDIEAKLEEVNAQRKADADSEKKAFEDKIAELNNERDEWISDLEAFDSAIEINKAKLDETQEIRQKMYELGKKIGVNKEALEANRKNVEKAAQVVKDKVDSYHVYKKSNEDVFVHTPVHFKPNGGNNTKALKEIEARISGLKKVMTGLGKIRLEIAKMFKKLIAAIVRVQTKYNNLVKEGDAIKAEMMANIEAMNDLKKEMELISGSEWKKEIKNLKVHKEILHEGKKVVKQNITRVNNEVKEVKRSSYGVSYMDKVLNNAIKTKGDRTETTYSNTRAGYNEALIAEKKKLGRDLSIEEKAEIRKEYLAEAETVLDISKTISISKPTTNLAGAELDTEVMNELVPEKEMEQFISEFVKLKMTAGELAMFPYMGLLVDNDGNVNKNVVAAVIAAKDSYVNKNSGMLGQLTSKDVEVLYGVDADSGNQTMEMLNGGVPQKHVAGIIGKDIGKMLGLKAKSVKDKDGNVVETNEEMLEKITLALGQIGLMHGIVTGDLQEIAVELDDGAKGYTVKLADKYIDENGGVVDSFVDAKRERALVLEDLIGLDDKAIKILSEPRVRESKDVKIKRNSVTSPATETAEAVVKMEAEEWTPNREVIDFILGVEKENLAKLLGAKKIDKKTMTAEERASAKAKNQQIDHDVAVLHELNDKYNNGELDDGVFFEWFVASNGRSHIEGEGGLDPQSIKLHRFALFMDGMKGTVKRGKMSETIFKLGFAQGLGLGVDKKKISKSVEFADSLLERKDAINVIEYIEGQIKLGNTEIDVDGISVKVKELSHTIQALTEAKKYIASNGGDFDTVMTMEVDGLTNGFSHKMLQYLATKDAKSFVDKRTIEWLHKAGIQVDVDGEAVDMSEQIDAGSIVDSYLTLGGSMAPEGGKTLSELAVDRAKDKLLKIEKIKDEEFKDKQKHSYMVGLAKKFIGIDTDRILNGDYSEIRERSNALLAAAPDLREIDEATGESKLSGFVRDLMKDPFMTFNYAAGFKSMSNSMASSLIDGVANSIMMNDSTENRSLAKALGFDNINALRADIRDKGYDSIINKDGVSLKEAFRGLIQGVYGDAVQDIMEEEFGAVIDINRSITSSTSAMFAIFKAMYDNELKERGITGAPTSTVQDEIVQELIKVFPIIESPLGDDLSQGIALFNTTQVDGAENKFGEAVAYRSGSGNSRKVKATRREISSPGSKAAVIPTQYTDGSNTTKIMNDWSLLQVFDAFVIGVEQSGAISQANKDFKEINLSEWSHIGAVSDALARIVKESDVLNDEKLMSQVNAILFLEQAKVTLGRPGLTDVSTLSEEETNSVMFAMEETGGVQGIMGKISKHSEAYKSRKADLLKRDRDIVFEQFVLDSEHAYHFSGSDEANSKAIDDIMSLDKKLDDKSAQDMLDGLKSKMANILDCK